MAGSDGHVHAFHEAGKNIIRGIIGKSAFVYKFKRKGRAAITLGNSSVVMLSILPYCSNVSWKCQNLEISPLKSYCRMNCAFIVLPTLKPRIYFVKHTSLRSFRQFAIMLQSRQVRLY
ncbi:hypothetical protein DPMN_072316 [Dreissena polymorpha]|uniref:Uncharacterized protein n=1 Tax=Dreissena polymorpha TaxID=45954 RepID=A0A9D3Z803_DREPO|nr:hypothetical protein DPMN_072316 [Dreissena polymorpha]